MQGEAGCMDRDVMKQQGGGFGCYKREGICYWLLVEVARGIKVG